MSKSKIRAFLESAVLGLKSSRDPFDDDYFNLSEYEKLRLESEPRLAEEAIIDAKAKAAKLEQEKKSAVQWESTDKPKQWSGYQ